MAVRSYQLCREALKKISSLVRHVGDACGWEKQESLYLAGTLRDVIGLRKEFEAGKAHGFDVE